MIQAFAEVRIVVNQDVIKTEFSAMVINDKDMRFIIEGRSFHNGARW